ncbi:hypothetical protein B0H17DRAFT_871733, partial [Mycena rosella]
PICVTPWNVSWMDESILVCWDERSIVRMKIYAACADGVKHIEDVFELAIRFGLPFDIFVDSAEGARFASQELSVLDDATLERIYAPNYADTLLSYGAGGEELYNQYLGQMNWLLKRPHARAFVAKGGVLSFVATLYNKELIQRFMEGPSLQVTHFGEGKTILLERDGRKRQYTADTIGPREGSLLLGHIPGSAAKEMWLWPPPSLIEGWSPHWR